MAKESPIMTEAEVSKYLKCTPFVLRQEVKRGNIPAVRMGVKWRFHRDALDQHFFAKKITPAVNANTDGVKNCAGRGAVAK